MRYRLFRTSRDTADTRPRSARKAIAGRGRSEGVVHRRLRIETLEVRQLLSVSAAGSEFLINSYTTGSQSAPALAMDADGDYVVVWTSNGQDGNGDGVFGRRFNALGAPQGSEFQVNSYTTGNQSAPAVAIDADGDFVVVWTSNGQDGSGNGVFAQRFNAAGVRQGIEFQVNSYTTSYQDTPKVAMDAAGDFVVTWRNAGVAAYADTIYLRRFNAAGVAQGSEFDSQFVVEQQTGITNSGVVADADGNFITLAEYNSSVGATAGFAQRYNKLGGFLGNLVANGTISLLPFDGDSSLAMDLDGDFVVTWGAFYSGSVEICATRFDAAGIAKGTTFRVNTYTTGHQISPRIALDADGDFVIAWSSKDQDGGNDGVYAQRFNALGDAQGSEFRVNTYTTNNQTLGAVALDAAGNFVMAWSSSVQDAGTSGVFAQQYDESTDSAGPVVANIYPADSAGVAANDSIAEGERKIAPIPKLVVTFSEDMTATGLASINSAHNWRLERNGVDITSQISGIAFSFNATANRYEALLSFTTPLSNGSFELTARETLTDLTGNHLDGDFDGSAFGEDYVRHFSIAAPGTVGSEFRANTITAQAERTSTNNHRSVATAPDGRFVVVWTGDDANLSYGVFARRYSADGVPLDASEFVVNTYTTGTQQTPSAAMDASGNFIVTWDGSGPGGDAFAVFARRFSAAGTPLDASEFRVNTYTTNNQHDPVVAMDSSGDFAIVWSSYLQDGAFDGVFARRYNSAAAPLDASEFRVNNYTSFGQALSTVAMDAAGNFVIAWNSRHQDGDWEGVFARRYSAAGLPLESTEFRVSSISAGDQNYPSVAMDEGGSFVVTWSDAGQDGGDWGVFAQRFSPSASPQGSVFRINTYTTNRQIYPSVAMDVDGDFVISWTSYNQDGNNKGVYARRYSAQGAPLDAVEFRVNTYTTGNQYSSSLAMDADGDFVIVWTSYGQDGARENVFAQRYAATALVQEVRLVGDTSEIDPGERLVQPIAAGPNLSATFSRTMSQIGGTSGVNSVTNAANWMLTKNGVDISSQITGVGYTGTTATLTLSAVLGDGNYVLTAKSTIQDADGRALDGNVDGAPGGDFARAFSIQQPAASGSEFRVNSYTTGGQGGTNASSQAIAGNASGDFVVIWHSFNQDGSSFGVYAQRYNAAGAPQGSEWRVNTYTTGEQANAHAAMDAQGNFIAAWGSNGQDGSSYGIYAQRYNAAGVPLGSEFRVNAYVTTNQISPRVAMDADGDFVVTWASLNQDGGNYGVYARRFNAAGVPQGTEFRVNTYTSDVQRYATIAMDSVGNFVITWNSFTQDGDNFGVYAQRFSAAGVPQGSEFRVNSYTTSIQGLPRIGMDSGGNFVIAWQSDIQDSSTYGIYARRYSAAGAPLGSEFKVNTYTTGIQKWANVALDDDGDFVITWASNLQDGSGYGAYAQRFDALGGMEGSEFRTTTTTSTHQWFPAVTVDADGDFVVAWSSRNQDGSGDGIYAQRFGGAPPVEVLSMTPAYDGVSLQFNRDFDPAVLNLYDQGGALGPADLTLTGASTGAVRGSVVVEPGSRKLTFIKSGGPLAADTYTVTLKSGATALWDSSGNHLDGNGDGAAGDDYTAKFTIASPPTGVTLAVGDFARGYSQAVNLPASSNTGLPITISNAVGVRSASFALVYNPALLSITGATIGSGITGSVSLDTSLVGIARITVTSGTQLSATSGQQALVNLTASVPGGATYASKEILELSSIELLDTSLVKIPAIGDDGIHVAAYFGDANGSQTYNSPDATLVQRLIVGTNTGLSAYQLADPYLIADITGNGAVQSNDVTLIQRAIVGTVTTQIPTHPGLAPIASGGPDPVVFIRQDLQGSEGSTILVPVELLVTERTGITLGGADLAIAYDASKFALSAVEAGQLMVNFGLTVNQSAPGLLKLSLSGSTALDLSHGATGTLAVLNFTILSGAGSTSGVNLLASSGVQTALYDAQGNALTLLPAVTDAADDAVDGLITILSNEPSSATTRDALIDSAFDSDDDFTVAN